MEIGLGERAHLIGGHVHEPFNPARLGALEQHVRAEHVVLRERERVAEGVVDVRLRGGVDDRVDLLRLQHVRHQVGAHDVPLDELVVRAVLHLVKVAQRAAVVELVEVDDLSEGWAGLAQSRAG